MPVTEGKYKCLECDDVFIASSEDGYTKCKCGKSEIYPCYGGYSYRGDHLVDTSERNTYYTEDEFVKFPEDIQAIYDEIKAFNEATGNKYYLHEMFEKGRNGEKYLSTISMSCEQFVSDYSHEMNEIELWMRLGEAEYKGDEIAKKRLTRFLNLMKKIESGQLDLAKRNALIKLAEEEDINYDSEPTGDMNYKFYMEKIWSQTGGKANDTGTFTT